MPRRSRIDTGGYVYHVLNRAVGRSRIFDNEADYQAMLRVIERTHDRLPIRLLSFCLMPNHWHFVLWPGKDGQLSEFMRLLTVTHTQRWHAHRHTAGTGPLYQGRFKSFPIERDEHVLRCCRYVERNALRANLVKSAADWPWCSLALRQSRQRPAWLLPQDQWPVGVGPSWKRWVNQPETMAELEALQRTIQRSQPYGDPAWQSATARKLSLESTLRPRGRQRVRPIKDSRPL